MFVGSFSDAYGRRLAYLGSFSVYIVANLALALQTSYPGLLLCRAIQATGSSGMVVMANGVVADLVVPAERGAYMGLASVANLLGPALAPVVGGIVTQYLGWHIIFWILFGLAAVMAFPFAIWFPETNRKLVGNGSALPPAASRPLITYIVTSSRRSSETADVQIATAEPAAQCNTGEKPRKKLQLPNPIEVIRIMLDPEGFVVLVGNGLVMLNMYAILTPLTPLIQSHYQLNDLLASLCFLPFGIASAASTVVSGKMLDREYKKRSSQQASSSSSSSSSSENTASAPIQARPNFEQIEVERARLKPTWTLFVLGLGSLLGYGWALDTHFHPDVHLAVVLVLLFLVGWTTTTAFLALNVLLIDNFPGQAATASAANNLVRCSLGAAMTAAVSPLIDSVGPGWTYTISAGLWAAMAPALGCLVLYGPGWRVKRKEQQKAKGESS